MMISVLITGSKGQLGLELVEAFSRRVVVEKVHSLDIDEMDITSRESVGEIIGYLQPDIIVHAAAMTQVDSCEDDPNLAYQINALGTRWVYEASRSVGARMCYVSTDYIFDGTSTKPYTEWDMPNPVSVYGKSKLAGEREVGNQALVTRTSWVVGRYGQNMVKTILRLAAQKGDLSFVDDQFGSPTVAHDLAEKIVQLSLDGRIGVYNVTNTGATSWYELAKFVLETAGHDPSRVKPISSDMLPKERKAPRPAYSVLAPMALELSGAGCLPHWKDSVGSLVRYLIEKD